jgi:hypothetical protein
VLCCRTFAVSHNYPFKWLVSCKHNATSGRAVSEGEEPNVMERIGSFKADGFLGMYSTVPTSGFNTRLRDLRDAGKIKDYSVIDGRQLERDLVTVGYSSLMMRYLPASYQKLKPAHNLTKNYLPLICCRCEEDIFQKLLDPGYIGANFVQRITKEDSGRPHIGMVYVICKTCDRGRERGIREQFEELRHLLIPPYYLRWQMSVINRLRDGTLTFEDEAFQKFKEIMITVAQKTMRYTSESDFESFNNMVRIFG